MSSEASKFIKNRNTPLALLNSRVGAIHSYILDCYTLLLNDQTRYSLTQIQEQTKIKPEDYFSNELVDKYLSKNKSKCSISPTEQIYFTRESAESYVDIQGISHNDPIDIHIMGTALQNAWGAPNEQIYLSLIHI